MYIYSNHITYTDQSSTTKPKPHPPTSRNFTQTHQPHRSSSPEFQTKFRPSVWKHLTALFWQHSGRSEKASFQRKRPTKPPDRSGPRLEPQTRAGAPTHRTGVRESLRSRGSEVEISWSLEDTLDQLRFPAWASRVRSLREVRLLKRLVFGVCMYVCVGYECARHVFRAFDGYVIGLGMVVGVVCCCSDFSAGFF